jgi:hypothetical protein
MQWRVPSSWWVRECSTSLEEQERVYRNFMRVLFLLDLGVDDAPTRQDTHAHEMFLNE